MSIIAERTFDSYAGNGQAPQSGRRTFGTRPFSRQQDDFVPAKYWLNIGYEADVLNEQDETETIFVSLKTGIPLDTMEMQDLKGSAFRINMLAAQNGMLEDLLEMAKALAPGESRIISAGDMLSLQIRHVSEAVSAPADGTNPLRKKLVA